MFAAGFNTFLDPGQNTPLEGTVPLPPLSKGRAVPLSPCVRAGSVRKSYCSMSSNDAVPNAGHIAEPVIILSDIHIGHTASLVSDISQLRGLFEGHRTVVFNGDTLEERTREGRVPAEKNRDLLEEQAELADSRLVFVAGNHDPTVSDIFHVELAGGAVLASHGHLFFDGVTPWSRKAKAASARHPMPPGGFDSFSNLAERGRNIAMEMEVDTMSRERGLLPALRLFAREMVHPVRPFIVMACWANAPRLAVRISQRYFPQARFIIMGHTHFPGVWRCGRHVVINTGSFSLPIERTAVRIDHGVLQIVSINRHVGGGYHLGRVKHEFSLSTQP